MEIIIGILAAIAIPVFLGQRERAQDSAAQSLVRSGATTMETCFAENETYVGCNAAALEQIEPNTNWLDAATGDAPDDEVGISNLGADTYTLASTSGSDTNFILTRAADGTISRTTTNPNGTW